MHRRDVFSAIQQERRAQQQPYTFTSTRLNQHDLRVGTISGKNFDTEIEGFSVGITHERPINTVQLVDVVKRTMRLGSTITHHQHHMVLIPPDFLRALYAFFQEDPPNNVRNWKSLQLSPDSLPSPEAIFSDTTRSQFIWGPPGTGKTYTLAREIAEQYLSTRQPLLITAIANLAVDQIFVETLNALHERGFRDWDRILRPSLIDPTAEARLNPNIQLPFLQEIRQQNRDIARLRQQLEEEDDPIIRLDLLQEIRLIRTNFELRLQNRIESADILASSIAKLHFSEAMCSQHGRFKTIAIDEAGFMPLVHAYYWGLQPNIQRLLIAGDPKQLSPISSCSYTNYTPQIENWILQSPFDVQTNAAARSRRFLDQQRRMHPHIGSYISKTFYDSRLNNHLSVVQRPIQRPLPIWPEMVLLDTHYKPANPLEHSRWSQAQITNIDERFRKFGVKKQSDVKSRTPHNLGTANIAICLALLALKNNPSCTIGVVTRYRIQNRILFKMIEYVYEKESQRFWGFSLRDAKKQITTSTVHRMQGGERDLILLDLVVGIPKALKQFGYEHKNWKNEERLINVAISRAKHQVVVLTNAYYTITVPTTSNPFIRRFADDADVIRMTNQDWNALER